MKRCFTIPVLILTILLSSCTEHYITYQDGEYVMFADTAATYPVSEDLVSFEVPVVSTLTCSYDRTLAVEILDKDATAVEGRDYTLESNTLVIKAGENKAMLKVNACPERIPSDSDDLCFTLRLVMNDRLVMPLYGDCTKVYLHRTCTFHRENFTGYAVVTSSFLYQYSVTGLFQRLIRTSADPQNPNGVILHDFLFDGYDVKMVFDDSDPMDLKVEIPSGQVVSNEGNVFGMVHGDDHILIENSPGYPNYFLPCKNIAVIVNRYYVENIGEEIGTVGNYMTEIDWISDEEARRLIIEEGF